MTAPAGAGARPRGEHCDTVGGADIHRRAAYSAGLRAWPECESGTLSSPSHVADTPITDRATLVGVLASGEKPRADWRIGTEHEKFGFRLDDLRPPTYEGDRGIGGTGVIGTIRRFGSIVVNDLRIAYPEDVQVHIDGTPATAGAMTSMQKRIWLLASAGKFFEGMIVFMVGVALPLITAEFDLTSADRTAAEADVKARALVEAVARRAGAHGSVRRALRPRSPAAACRASN